MVQNHVYSWHMAVTVPEGQGWQQHASMQFQHHRVCVAVTWQVNPKGAAMKPNPTTLADTYRVAGPHPCSDFRKLGMWQSTLN